MKPELENVKKLVRELIEAEMKAKLVHGDEYYNLGISYRCFPTKQYLCDNYGWSRKEVNEIINVLCFNDYAIGRTIEGEFYVMSSTLLSDHIVRYSEQRIIANITTEYPLWKTS